MNKKLIALALILSLISSTLSLTHCGSSYYCSTGSKCCKRSSGGYSCCPSGFSCSSSGSSCSLYLLSPGKEQTPVPSTPAIEELSYLDIIMMVDGFLNASKFYKNFPHCTKVFTKFVSMAPQIVNLVKAVKAAEDTEKLIIVIVQAIEEFAPKLKGFWVETALVPAEIKQKIKEILNTLKTQQYYLDVLKHLLSHIGDVIDTINNAKKAFDEEKYAQFGRYLGIVVTLVLNIK